MPKKNNKEQKPRKTDEGFGFHTVILLTIFFFVIVTFVVVVLWAQMAYIKSDIQSLKSSAEASVNLLKSLV